MDSVNQTFLKAVAYFPRWLALRRKPYTSVQGHLLYSILNEADYVAKAIQDYKKDFFLVNYLGKEDTIVETLYAAHVGTIDDFTNIEIANFQIPVTQDITIFQTETDTIYYQDGYFLIRPRFIDKDHTYIEFTYNGYPYRIEWQKMHVWNIFDEFAWFAGLSRYTDETNKDLCARVINTFKNRTNITLQGLKNALVNISSAAFSESDIRIEQPDENSLALPDTTYGTIFERLAQENKDLARTKQWDTTYWENSFKQLSYLPHVWDTPVEAYQDGTGYNDSARVYTTDELSADVKSTTVQITAYKKSKRQIEEYIQHNAITKDLTLQLKRYKDVIHATTLQYRILASNVVKLNPEQVTFTGYQTSSGTDTVWLSDIALNTQNVTEEPKGLLTDSHTYELVFYPDGPADSHGNHYGSMQIAACDILSGNQKTSLLKPAGSFAVKDGVFQNVDVKFYTDTVKNLTTYENLRDTEAGICIADLSRPAQLSIDVSDAKNQYVYVQKHCDLMDYTLNTEFVIPSGFFVDGSALTSNREDSTSTIDITMTAVSDFSFELAPVPDSTQQGAIVFDVTAAGKTVQHTLTTAGTFSLSYDLPTDIRIHIRKEGLNPVTIRNIQASRYQFAMYTENKAGQKSPVLSTPFGQIIPGDAETLYIDTQAYGNSSPYLEFIHIGPTLDDSAAYTIRDIQAKNSRLSIRTNCRVDLVDTTAGTITRNFTTHSVYRNDTQDNGIIFIDVSKYVDIEKSDPEIYRDDTTLDNYVVVPAGQSLERVTITGTVHQLVDTRKLSDILAAQQLAGYSCYANRHIGLIAQNDRTEKAFTITRNMLDLSSDVYRVQAGDELRTIFIQDDTHKVVASETDKPFEAVTFEPSAYQEYVAYNKLVMLQPEQDHVPIVYNFSPALSMTTLVVYQVTDIPNDTHIRFEQADGLSDWSLGKKDLRITLDTKEDDTSSYQVELKTLEQPFLLSTTIPLSDTYTIDGQLVTLAAYLITPPKGMKVDYEPHAALDTIRIETDGFTKLVVSNVTSVESVTVGSSVLSDDQYTLLSDAGLIVWNDKSLLGQTADIRYVYQKPVSLSFLSIDDIYDLVGYIIDAYERINDKPDVYPDKKAGDVIHVDYPDASHITAYCTADGFIARPSQDNKTVTVYALSATNQVAVHNGYLYDAGLEYWLFANRYEQPFLHYDGVEFVNVKRLPGQLLFFIQSTNHIQNSAMIPSYLDTLCVVDFLTNKHVPEISYLQSITACDSFTGWHAFNMDVGLQTDPIGSSLSFSPVESYGYAALDVTDYVHKNDTIDIQYTGDLTFYWCEDIPIQDMRLRKNVFARPAGTFTNGVYTVKTYRKKSSYYLVVTGTGVIQEIVITNQPVADVHTKNLTKFGFTVTEDRQEGSVAALGFTPSFARTDGIEWDRKGSLMLGTNVDYNLTLLQDIDFSTCQINQITYLKDIFETGSETGSILTQAFEIPNYPFIKAVFLKINNVLLDDSYTNYTVELLASDYIGGPYVSSYTQEDTNQFAAPKKYLKKYIRFRITMPKESVVDNLSILGQYSDAPRVKYQDKGVLYTKLFDACIESDYQLTALDVSRVQHPEFISFEIRACRGDGTTTVWTDWEPVTVDETFAVTSEHVFRDYRLFQLRVTITDSKSRIHLDGIRVRTVK